MYLTLSSEIGKKARPITLLNSFAFFMSPPASRNLWWSLSSDSRVRRGEHPRTTRASFNLSLRMVHHKQQCRPMKPFIVGSLHACNFVVVLIYRMLPTVHTLCTGIHNPPLGTLSPAIPYCWQTQLSLNILPYMYCTYRYIIPSISSTCSLY